MSLLSVIIVIMLEANRLLHDFLSGRACRASRAISTKRLTWTARTTWQQIRYITLPLLRRTTLFVLVIALTFAFQTVEQLQALGQGKPGDGSNLLLYYIFQNIGRAAQLGLYQRHDGDLAADPAGASR